MKVLHIWNTAGVGSIISRELNMVQEVECKVVAKKNKFNFDSEETISVVGGSKSCALYGLLIAKNYDIIHVHTVDVLIPIFRKIYPKKTIILTYHGSEIRSNNLEGRPSVDITTGLKNQWHLRKKFWAFADAITVTTPDLLGGAPEKVRYIPAPVERNVWSRQKKYETGTACYVQTIWGKQGEADKIAYLWAKEKKLDFYILKRSEQTIPYLEYPRILEKFEYFLDIRQCLNGEIINCLSMTALQFLSLGGKVYYNGEIHKKFPKDADSKEVAKKTLKLYNDCWFYEKLID